MERLNSVKCNSCGASLPVGLKATSVKCAFCGSTRAIAAGELQARRQAAGSAAVADNECRRAMASYAKHSLAPRAVVVALRFFAPFIGIPMLLASVGFWAKERFPLEWWLDAAVPLTVMGGCAGGMWAAFAGIRRFADDLRVKTELATKQLLTQVTSRPQRGGCPQCAGEVQVPSATAALDCPFCGASLVASAGILIRWVDDAAARSRSWQEKARDAFAEHEKDFGPNRFPAKELAAMAALGFALMLIISLGPRLYETLYQVYRMETGQMYTPTW